MVDLAAKYYNLYIYFFRSDSEKALGLTFENILSNNGIVLEHTIFYIPAQNSKTERSRGVIT